MRCTRTRVGGFRGAALLAVAILALSCGGSSPAPPDGTVPAGTIPVRGSERLAWDQAGDVSDLRFLAYVDGQPASLDAAACDAAQAGPQGAPCVSPLPPLSVGVHTIALSAVSRASGLESAQSQPITVQKLAAATASGGASRPSEETTGDAAERVVPDTVATADGLTFDVEVLARGLEATAQLALAPDGRLFVADQAGRVHLLADAAATAAARGATLRGRLDGLDPALALDAQALLDPPPAGPPGLAAHPDFERNQFVYLAYVALDAREQARLELVRLREAGGTLGEPAVLFGQPLAGLPADGPRLAFGPDRHLYITLPDAATSSREAPTGAAGGVILRVDDEGRAPGGAVAFAPGSRQPLALAWHPRTRDLWAVLAHPDGRATLERVGCRGPAPERCAAAAATALPDAGRVCTPGGFAFYPGSATDATRTTAFITLPDGESLWRVTPGDASPTEALLRHTLGRIGDIVTDERGVLYLGTRNRDRLGNPAAGDDLIVRLTPRAR
jgi:glucose/arabinose dehydrogenase